MRIRFKRPVDRLRDPRIFCAAKGTKPNRVQLNINSAREAFRSGRPENALMYLDRMIAEYSHGREIVEATGLFVEAKRMFEEANDSDLSNLGLCIAEHGFKLGRSDEAKVLFDRVIGYIETETNKTQRDEIRVAAAQTYIRLGKADEAFNITGQIEEVDLKFIVFLFIARSLMEEKHYDKAKMVLLNYCAVIARQRDERSSSPEQLKVARLLEIAGKLIELSENEEAEKFLDEGINILPRSWFTRKEEDLKLLEEAALLLLEIGRKQKAINLLTDGWLDEEYLATLSPEQEMTERVELINTLDFSTRLAKALLEEEKTFLKWSEKKLGPKPTQSVFPKNPLKSSN